MRFYAGKFLKKLRKTTKFLPGHVLFGSKFEPGAYRIRSTVAGYIQVLQFLLRKVLLKMYKVAPNMKVTHGVRYYVEITAVW